jgi:hypothetical protein
MTSARDAPFPSLGNQHAKREGAFLGWPSKGSLVAGRDGLDCGNGAGRRDGDLDAVGMRGGRGSILCERSEAAAIAATTFGREARA